MAFYFQKTAMSHVGLLLFLGLRGAIAVLALAPFALIEQKRRGDSGGNVFPSAMLVGLVTATVINTGLLTALYVAATPSAFWAIKRQAPPSAIWLSVGLAFAGTWMLGGGSFGDFSKGDMLVGGAALLWGHTSSLPVKPATSLGLSHLHASSSCSSRRFHCPWPPHSNPYL